MPVPAQVQAQADRADAMLKELSDKEKASSAAAGNPPENQGKPNQPDGGAPPPEETVESLKHKLAVLQGKYNNEIQALKDDVNLLNNLKNQVRTLTGQNQDLSGKLAEANRLNGELQKQITEKPAPAKDDGKGSLSDLSEEDRDYLRGEGFDDKAIEIILKAVKQKAPAQPAKPTQDDELSKLRKEIEDEKTKMFWEKFTDKVPDWQPINTSDEFNDWLDLTLQYSTETRRERLQAAQQAADYGTAIQIFTDFKGAYPNFGKKPDNRLDPNKQIEPANSVVNQRDPEGKEKPAGKIYTRQEIDKFYKDFAIARAQMMATPEQIATDADIMKAYKEGRIQG